MSRSGTDGVSNGRLPACHDDQHGDLELAVQVTERPGRREDIDPRRHQRVDRGLKLTIRHEVQREPDGCGPGRRENRSSGNFANDSTTVATTINDLNANVRLTRANAKASSND